VSRTLSNISLFNLGIRHGFYTAGNCRDFTFRPLTECQDLLQQYKLNFFPGSAGFQVSCQARINGLGQTIPLIPPSEIPNGTRFSFAMQLKNPEFNLKTRLFDPTQGQSTIRNRVFHFDSLNAATELDSGNNWLEKVKLYDPAYPPGSEDYPRSFTCVGSKLSYSVEELNPSINQAQIWVYGSDEGENGLPVSDLMQTIVKNVENQFRVALDLTGNPQGVYTFVLRKDGAVIDRRQYFHCVETSLKNDFGVVEIRKTADWDLMPTNPAINYSIRFLSEESVWRYFLVYKTTTFPNPATGTYFLEDGSSDAYYFKNVTAQGASQAMAWIRITGFSGNANQVKKVDHIEIGQGNGKIDLLGASVLYQNGDTPNSFAERLKDAINVDPLPFPHNYSATIDPGDNQKIVIRAPFGSGTWPNGFPLSVDEDRVNLTQSNTISGGSAPNGNLPDHDINGFPAEVFLSQTDPGNKDTRPLPVLEAPKKGLQLVFFNPSLPLDSNNPLFLNRGVPVPAINSSGKWFDPDLNTEFNTKDHYIFI
jgi:hypothetical protein